MGEIISNRFFQRKRLQYEYSWEHFLRNHPELNVRTTHGHLLIELPDEVSTCFSIVKGHKVLFLLYYYKGEKVIFEKRDGE